MAVNTHLFFVLSELIDKVNKERNNMNVDELQELRENISLNLFYISDDAAKAISNYDAKAYERKRLQAEKEESFRNAIDSRTNKVHTVADSERLARIELKTVETEEVEALRQKERVRIILTAVQQILNSISSRINQLSK